MDRLDLNVCYEQLGFTEAPFRITPDTDYFFRSPQHLHALEHLQFGIASGELTMLTGEVGVGKTLVCRYLLRHPPKGVHFAYLLNPDQSYADLLGSIYRDLPGRSLKVAASGPCNGRCLTYCCNWPGRVNASPSWLTRRIG